MRNSLFAAIAAGVENISSLGGGTVIVITDNSASLATVEPALVHVAKPNSQRPRWTHAKFIADKKYSGRAISRRPKNISGSFLRNRRKGER
jgi:hypothetical protein